MQKSLVSFNYYLKSLDMICSIRLAEEKDVKWAVQLTQRTNQFDLTTRRCSGADITTMRVNPNCRIYVLGFKDKFGDNGITGLILTLQKEFKVTISPADAIDLTSVKDIIRYLTNRRVSTEQ